MTLTIALLIAVTYWQSAPTCVASWYGHSWDGLETTSGLIYNADELTCAHCYLDMGILVSFYNPDTRVHLIARVTDGGPWAVDSEGKAKYPLRSHPSRQFDLSQACYDSLTCGDLDSGIVGLRWRVVGRDITDMRYGTGVSENAAEIERLDRW